MDRLEFCMDFKYFVEQATIFSGKLTNKIRIYIQKSYFTVIGENPSRLFWKENMHTKKAKMYKLWSTSTNILDTKIKYQQIIIISPCNRCYEKVMYKSYTSNSSSCFSQTSTCQSFRPSCTSFITPSSSSLHLQSRGHINSPCSGSPAL